MDRTNRLHLPLFESTDKPSWLTDWNLAMTVLDDAISDLEIGGIPNLAELLERLSNIESKQASDETIMQTIASCFANNFSSAITYSKGDLVLYENSLYEYTYITPSSGDFDGTKWSLRQLEDLLGPIKDSIGSLGIQTSEIATGLSALESSVAGLRTSVDTTSAKADSADTKADNALSVAKSKKSAFALPNAIYTDSKIGNLPSLTTMTASSAGGYELRCPILTQFPNAGLNETDSYRLGFVFNTPKISIRFNNSSSEMVMVRLEIAIERTTNLGPFVIFSKDFYFANVTSATSGYLRPVNNDRDVIVAPFFTKMKNGPNDTTIVVTLRAQKLSSGSFVASGLFDIQSHNGDIEIYKVQTHSS